MTARHGRDNRDVIPRWRPFGKAARTGELASYQPDNQSRFTPGVLNDMAEVKQAFEDDPGIYTAGDLLSHAMVQAYLDDSVSAAASFILDDTNSTDVVRRLAAKATAPLSERADIGDPTFDFSSARLRARNMKRIVRREPRNAVRWVDLALAHVNLGELQSAETELQVALRLAPNNRHVLRSATRFYLLRDRPDQAQWLLRNSPETAHDPWLQAAELAVSELTETGSRRIRQARQTMDQASFHPRHLSELASELATAELRAGRVRQAKRYMRAALVDPTENALAQAEWASGHGIIIPDANVDNVLWSFEAEALWSLDRGDFKTALQAGRAWQRDQPFAADAATFTSYVATVGTEDWVAAAEAARQGLVANPNDVMLRNNLIFSLASLGDLAGCMENLIKLPANIPAGTRATVLATKGLVAFRVGWPERGVELYTLSADLFKKLQDKNREKVARLLLLREELLAGLRSAEDAVASSRRIADGTDNPEVELWRKRIQTIADRPPMGHHAIEISQSWKSTIDRIGSILDSDAT